MPNKGINKKAVLTARETAQYMGVSMSYLYKLTCNKEIPHYKPKGKMVYFDRLELEAWLHGNRIATNAELKQEAINYCQTKKGGAK